MEILGGEALFGTTTRTTTLLMVAMLGETHVSEIARISGRSPSRIKVAVDGLERAGAIVGATEGTVRRLTLNPRYAAADELRALLTKLGTLDVDLQTRLATL